MKFLQASERRLSDAGEQTAAGREGERERGRKAAADCWLKALNAAHWSRTKGYQKENLTHRQLQTNPGSLALSTSSPERYTLTRQESTVKQHHNVT